MPHAIRLHKYGGPEVLCWEEIAVGDPAPNEIRIRQEAVGLNFIDIYYRTGLYKLDGFPATLGLEGAGIIESVGGDVKDLKPGDRVAYASRPPGAYAEVRLMPADNVVTVPEKCSSRTAAAIMLQGMTAHYLVHDTFHLGKGHTILLHAAAGGVGQILTQWAKAKGAIVIGSVGSDAKAARVRELGADHAIVYTREDFVTRVRDITGGKGVDVVYDSVGQATFMGSLDCLKPRGLMVSFGQASGSVAPFDPGLLATRGSLFLTRPSLMNYNAHKDDLRRRARDLFAAIDKGIIKPEIGRTFALKDAAAAHRALESRQTMGSVVLLP